MFAGHEEEESSGWQAAGDVRSDGWPLGLQQDPMRRGFPEAPALFISTPSVTSESSSDLDTESTGSFFPERSHTLGSLIGIHTNAQNEQVSKALVEAHSMVAETEKRRSISAGGLRSRGASWCSMLGCGGGSNPGALGMSSSLAHLLEEERRAGGSQRQQSNSNVEEEGGGAEEEGEMEMPSSLLMHRNTLFDEEGILPPHPTGAPLKLILQHTSPSSSYLSADWNVFNTRHPAAAHRDQGGAAPSHGRFPTFWPGLCGRLGTGLAG